MYFYANRTKTYVTVLLAVLGTVGIASSQTQPDNTRSNKGDADKGVVTADQQKMNASDRVLTQNIRKAVMADKSLSTYAHNVKIVSQNGMVTLRGPVRSDDEKKSIIVKAVEAAGGPDKVSDQMSVTADSR
jgi:hyperosmotically inducible periplasmic protein